MVFSGASTLKGSIFRLAGRLGLELDLVDDGVERSHPGGVASWLLFLLSRTRTLLPIAVGNRLM